jgi:hypothetical protein
MRVDHLEKRKSMEVRVPRADFIDSVLTHQDRRMRIVDQIAGKPRKFGDDLGRNGGMSLGRYHYCESGRAQKG